MPLDFLNKLSSKLPFIQKGAQTEYFFGVNIGAQKLNSCVWTVTSSRVDILNTASLVYKSEEDLENALDKVLDQSLGDVTAEPEKILFGVPQYWLLDNELKPNYLKLLQRMVKTVELRPLAYVSTAHAIELLLEKKESAPLTGILMSIDKEDLDIGVVRAGKIDGVKTVKRGDNLGIDAEKVLLSFTEVEILPSKILIYGQSSGEMAKYKETLLAFPWMQKLSFLHFPKIDILEEDVEVKAVALAGAVEVFGDLNYQIISEGQTVEVVEPPAPSDIKDFGFVVGDISKKQISLQKEILPVSNERESLMEERGEIVDKGKIKFLIPVFIIIILILAYLFLPKAIVKIYVEPRILEKDAQVSADPKIKEVDIEKKVIPGQIIETQISASEKGPSTGKKEIGDPAKGTVVIYNKTNESKSFSKGISLTGSRGLKFTLDSSVNIASQSAVTGGITFGKVTTSVTASSVGPDSNLPSGSELSVSNLATSQVLAQVEGNFSGGTSKTVTIVSDADQKKLLAALASTLRKKATEELQKKLAEGNKGMKILEEALTEEIVKKSYSKNINDQASEFSLSLTARYSGTAYAEDDLKQVIATLIDTDVPVGFELNLSESETQSDVSKVEKDGRLIFLSRFRAKLVPKLDENKLKSQIRGKTPNEVSEILKNYENVLEGEVLLSPSLPGFLTRVPVFVQNIKLEVGLK